MGRVVILGSSNTDLVLQADKLPAPGQTVLGREFLQFPGGKGANQVVAAARAGAEVVFLGAIGSDGFGRAARNNLEAEGVNVDHLIEIPGAASGVALIVVDDTGQNQIGVGPGANAMIGPDTVNRLPDAVFTAAGVFVTQLETPLQTNLAALQRAKTFGLTCIFNPAPANATVASPDWLTLVDVLVVNEHEARELARLEQPVRTVAEAEQAYRILAGAGCRNVIVTLGKEGFVLCQPDQCRQFPGHQVAAVDAVGAGDTFVGALACGLSEDRALADAARWANKAAALAVTQPGAQSGMPRHAQIDALHD